MPELVVYGIRLLAQATPRNSPRHREENPERTNLTYLDGLDTSVRMTNTEVLLQVERVLGYPERIPHVGPHHLQALHTLLAGVAVWRQSLIGKFYRKLLKSPRL